MNIAYLTLGCKLNYAESSTYERELEKLGHRSVSWNSAEAEAFLVNTCSVTEHSDKKCRNIVRKLHRLAPTAPIFVCGCSAQLRKESLEALDGVVRVFGAWEKGEIVRYIQNYSQGVQACASQSTSAQACANQPTNATACDAECPNSAMFKAYSSGERTRSFLKVQDGCDYKCHYCTVPYARGESRNAPIADIIEQAREIAQTGIQEIVLTGVNTGDFGKTTNESFFDLLKALEEVEGIERYRISSIEPNLLTEEIIDWIASSSHKFLPHFHIPLQSGSDDILSAMGRRYSQADFAHKIAYIRQKMGEDVFLGIDVIVGFPGESDAHFQETYQFLKEIIRPAFIHLFPYSKRPGTPAATMKNQVQDRLKTDRVAELEKLCKRLHGDFIEKQIGQIRTVLFESSDKNGFMYGFTENYIKIKAPYDARLVNRMVSLRINKENICHEGEEA